MLSESVRKRKKALSKERKLKCKEESQEKVRLVRYAKGKTIRKGIRKGRKKGNK